MSGMVHRVISIASALVLAALAGMPAEAAQKKKTTFTPGKARWEIKTTIPDDANVGNAKDVDLQTVLAIKPPPGAKGHSRRMDSKRYPEASNAAGLAEGEMIKVSGWIHLIAAEPDGDYHIQVARTKNSQTRCFIVEVPRPVQRFVKNDRVREAAATVREAIKSNILDGKELKYGASRQLKPPKTSPVFAAITGQFFYDDWHIGDKPRGKKGCKSPTITEIHPIMAIEFPTPP